MFRDNRTLVALSGTEADRPLVTYARMLADLGIIRHCHFVHVRAPARAADDHRLDAELQRSCEVLVEQAFAGTDYSITCQVLVGIRVDLLIEFSAQHRCHVILLGHRSSRSGQRSLARRLAMVAPCSVWLVPESAPVSIRQIMVPIDFSDHSADSLGVATSIARSAGLSECSAVHVFSDPAMIGYEERLDEIRHHETESFQHFISTADTHGIEVRSTFIEGHHVARTLLYTAGLQGADLVVMNTRGRSRSASVLLGSVTAQVMSESPIGVLAVKHFGAMLNLYQALQQSAIWKRETPKTN